MSIADKYRPHYTYDDYLLWEGRWELIEGMPYAMSPAPNPTHQNVNANLATIFTLAVKNCDKCKVYLPLDWKMAENTVLQPDLLVVCKKIEKSYLDFPPSLVVEILSPSTAYKERHEKFELYEQEGVKYYLIVDPPFKKIEVYELIEKKYQPVSISPSQFEFILENNCNCHVDFESTWG